MASSVDERVQIEQSILSVLSFLPGLRGLHQLHRISLGVHVFRLSGPDNARHRPASKQVPEAE